MRDRPNGYLACRPQLPTFQDLALAAVEAIEHDEFSVTLLRPDADGRLSLAIQSPTRHHTVDPVRLEGTETQLELVELALEMVREAMAEDVDYRFRFRGCPIFARAGG